MNIGFHLPLLKTFEETIRYHHIQSGGIRSFQLFTKNPRQTQIKKINEEDAKKCKEYMEKEGIFLVTHASYLLNMSNSENWEKKIENGKNELDLAEKIGAKGTVFHVGKHLKLSVKEGEDKMYEYIQTMIQYLQEKNYQVKYVIETSARCGTELLWKMEDLGAFFHRFTEEEKKHLAICIDTCHIFSAGYRIHNEEGCNEYIQLVGDHIGWENVMVIHLNDSLSLKGCGCKLDRHANIMKGFIQDGMKRLIEFTTDFGIPHVLETPYEENKIFDTHLDEIQMIQKWFQ